MKKLKLSVSTERFERKEDIIPKRLKFEQDLLTVEEFKGKVKEGYCFCHWFNTTKDVFSIAEKTKNNFDCANVVFVDVDDYDVEMKEFVRHLPQRPTVYYTTPSNGKMGNIGIGYAIYSTKISRMAKHSQPYITVLSVVLELLIPIIPTRISVEACQRNI